MRFMFGSTFLLCIAGVVACSSSPVTLSPEEAKVMILEEPPKCEYKNLGLITASTGSVGLDIKGNKAATLSKLRKQAHALGANAVILRAGGFNERPWYSNGDVYQMDGDAIINCQ